MIGDKLVIKKKHTDRAVEITGILKQNYKKNRVVSVSGESGAGKSEMALEIRRLLNGNGIKTEILQQDDYFVFPPKTNARMRRNNIEQVGLYEVKLDFLDSNLRSFKKGEGIIYKPLVDFDADSISCEELDLSGTEVLIVEGTFTSILDFVDYRIFIDCNFRQTLEARRERNREEFDGFIEDVLVREHEIIKEHKSLADIVIASDYGSITIK